MTVSTTPAGLLAQTRYPARTTPPTVSLGTSLPTKIDAGLVMARSSVLGNATRVEPRSADRESVAVVSRIDAEVSELVLRLPDGQEITLPATLVKILLASAGELSEGHALTVLAARWPGRPPGHDR